MPYFKIHVVNNCVLLYDEFVRNFWSILNLKLLEGPNLNIKTIFYDIKKWEDHGNSQSKF